MLTFVVTPGGEEQVQSAETARSNCFHFTGNGDTNFNNCHFGGTSSRTANVMDCDDSCSADTEYIVSVC